MEFSPEWFQVKDLSSGPQLITGKAANGGYEWPASDESKFFAYSATIKSPLPIWHSRLEHPSFSTLKTIVSHYSLPVSNKDSSLLCNACSISKSHKIPFSTSTLSSTQPLELIYSDVWTSQVHSINGFKYYVIFVDHFTHYICFTRFVENLMFSPLLPNSKSLSKINSTLVSSLFTRIMTVNTLICLNS